MLHVPSRPPLVLALAFLPGSPALGGGAAELEAAVLERWNERLESLPASDREILVIQGTADTTVDGEHNLDVEMRDELLALLRAEGEG